VEAYAFRHVPVACIGVAATRHAALLHRNPVTFQIIESIIVFGWNASY
jgi:hypothetical protein